MSISERERQALDSIENELARSAPRLASMLAMFSRLTSGEQMPAREPAGRAAGAPGSPAGTAGRAGPRRVWRRRIGGAALAWLWLAAVAALLALMVTLTHDTRVSPCTHSLTTACQQTTGVHPAGG